MGYNSIEPDDGSSNAADILSTAMSMVRILSRYPGEYLGEVLDDPVGRIRITMGEAENTVMETDCDMPGYEMNLKLSKGIRKEAGMKGSDGLPILELTEAIEIADLTYEWMLFPKDPASRGNLIGTLSRYLGRKDPGGNGSEDAGDASDTN